MTKRSGPSRASIWFVLVVLCLLWGSTWVVIREGLVDLPPFWSAGYRFALAGVLMTVLAFAIGRRESGGAPPVWLWLACGLGNFAGSYGFVYWAEQTVPSGLSSLLWAVFPLLMAASGHFFLPGEQLNRRKLAGFVLGFAGVAFLFRTDLASLGPEVVTGGALLLLSPVCACAGTILIKRYGGESSSLLLNRNGMLTAAAVLLAIAWATEPDAAIDWTPRAIFSVIYLAVMGTVATFGMYFWLLRYAPASQLSLIAYVTPPIAVFLGWAVAGEPVTAATLSGAALILAGVLLVVRNR